MPSAVRAYARLGDRRRFCDPRPVPGGHGEAGSPSPHSGNTGRPAFGHVRAGARTRVSARDPTLPLPGRGAWRSSPSSRAPMRDTSPGHRRRWPTRFSWGPRRPLAAIAIIVSCPSSRMVRRVCRRPCDGLGAKPGSLLRPGRHEAVDEQIPFDRKPFEYAHGRRGNARYAGRDTRRRARVTCTRGR